MSMYYEGFDAKGRKIEGGMARLVYCGKCNQPLFSGILEPNTVLSTNGLVHTKSGCCRTTVISVLAFLSKEQIQEEPMPRLFLSKGTIGPGEWDAKINEDGEVSLKHKPSKKVP
jgi:hypothetical protein